MGRLLAPAAAVALLAVGTALLISAPGPAGRRAAPPPTAPPVAPGGGGKYAEQQVLAPPAVPHAPQQQQQPALHSRPAAGGLHIVRFRQYRMAPDHHAALDAALPGAAAGWEWVERRNKAAAHPTDFGLVRLAAGVEGALKERLGSLPFVRDVHPERVLTRSLMAATAEAVAAAQHAQFAPCQEGGQESLCVAKRPGRLTTRPTFSLEDNQEEEEQQQQQRVANDTVPASGGSSGGARRRRARQRGLLQSTNLATLLQADAVWAQGFKGQGVKMGVFDTGIKGDHPDVKHIDERTNWTHEPTLEDGLGHGSFVAGVIAGTDPACPGLAPEVSLHTFRVFTNDQVSYTSWFLDAFNYAMATGMNIVNLSIGGPDHLDAPFVDKVAEITSSGIIMVSAIGNDGPLYGTLNNPADQNDVIGIGGIDFSDHIAPFSSRGMSTWELPLGYGRSKPDVMAYGRDVQGSRIGGGCRSLSGTSVASPVVAGAVCLLASVVPLEKRWQLLNPASMKQALVEGAIRLPGLNLYEQGAGKLSVTNSKAVLEKYEPRASLVPAALNFTDCPYMWPFCRQPLYATAMPVVFNATILNGLGLVGALEGPPTWAPADAGGQLLDVRFEHSEQLWPWSGFLALYLRVKDEGAAFSGTASGEVTFTVVSPPGPGEAAPRKSTVRVPLTAAIVPTPPRAKRVLWDQFHSIRYPPAYFPRDDLQVRHDILDWHGDHLHTNFHDMANHLRDAGYFLEVLASPATCFNASLYGALAVVDSEDEFYRQEIAKLAADVSQAGLGLVIFADWYHEDTVRKLRFFDDNTRSWWDAATGGANVPALNDLLTPFGAAYDPGALEADMEVAGLAGQGAWQIASGVTVKALPAGAWVHRARLKAKPGEAAPPGPPALALFQHGAGRVVLYGDSNCLDSSHSRSKCFGLLASALEWAAGGDVPALTPPSALLAAPQGDFNGMPQRRSDFNFSAVSLVLQRPLQCYPNAPLEYQGASFAQWDVPVTRPAQRSVAAVAKALQAQQQEQQQEQQQQQQQQQQAQQQITDSQGREHPDITGLAQPADGGPHGIDDQQRPLLPADKVDGEGAAARASSLMHQAAAGVAGGGSTSSSSSRATLMLLVQVAVFASIVGVAVWLGARRRRGLASMPLPSLVRLHSRKLLLPLWRGRSTTNGDARDRHE